MTCFPNKKVTQKIQSLIDEWLLEYTESGCINKDAFVYIKFVFCIQITHSHLYLLLSII